ncbi:conserved hypothetical protein [Serratia proteamaculans]|nr:conserved hypothetical protein [Serratia proteamaculans]
MCVRKPTFFLKKPNPIDFELQLGGKGGSPRKLTQVSDRGERPQLTTL